MANDSRIEWTDATWNPVTGCDRVSPGCANCYALEFAGRLKAMGKPKYQKDGKPGSSGPGFGVTLHPSTLDQPLKWTRPRKIFVNSMSDLFHEDVPDSFIDLVFAVMAAADHHVFQILTKRPERMRDYLLHRSDRRIWESLKQPWPGVEEDRREALRSRLLGAPRPPTPLPNVWLGVSIENRRFVGRADVLRETPAAVRFISAEPLLGPLVPLGYGANRPPFQQKRYPRLWDDGKVGPILDLSGIDWLIVGGESGPGHRPIDPAWVRDLRDYTRQRWSPTHPSVRPAFFFKQWGGVRPTSGGNELDGQIWSEIPSHLVPESHTEVSK